MSKILITGIAGFIGSHLAEYWLSNSENVIIGIDNFNDYYNPNFKFNNLNLLQSHQNSSNRFFFYKGDIRDKKFTKELFNKEKFDQVIHLAAMAGVRYSIENPDYYVDVNINGTLNLLNCCKNHDVNSLIFASSSSVYGNSKMAPFKESQSVDKPISPYAATKKAGEEFCFLYHHLYNINVTCLRFFTVYGPRGRPDMAPFKFLDRINRNLPIERYGNGTSQRDYTYIDDIIQGIVKAANKNYEYEIFNLGRGQTVELNEFISIIERVTTNKAIIEQLEKQPGDVDLTSADIKKAAKMLGYNPKWSIKNGIKETYEWLVNC